MWHYTGSNGAEGPLSDADFIDLVARKKIKRDTPVAHPQRTGGEWRYLHQVATFTALSVFFAVSATSADAVAKDSAAAKRPNIVFCMADDWSWPHAGILGDPVVKTPSFDRIAREGVLFENAFVSTPSCTPSRLSILTGQHHWRLREGDSLGGSLREDFDVYTEMLQQAGYRIGRFGKGVWPSKHSFRKRDSFGERFRSFDDFLKDRDPGEPFCYWHGGQDPHRPYELGVGQKSGIALSKIKVPACLPDHDIVRSDVADYLWEVQRFDRQVGQIVAKLKAIGELEDTIIVVSGDNGMPFPRCKATLYDQGTRVPLAIRWGSQVKGGRRVEDFVSLCDLAPTFLEAAGEQPSDQMTGRSLLPLLKSSKSGQVDEARTFALTGMERHVYSYPSRALRTRDFLFIRNFHPERWPSGEVKGHNPTYDFASQPWPTERGAFSFNIDPSPSKQFLRLHRDDVDTKRYARLAFLRHPTEELYDLRKDPDQLNNVASDPLYERIRRKLNRQLETELIDSADPQVAVGDDKSQLTGSKADASKERDSRKEPTRPNILYLYVDDMGWGSIGPNGQAARRAKNLPYVRTPNLDRLARQGVNFTRGYGCHVCSPARSSQQSGFHQGHTFADRNDPNNAKKAMRADDILIGDALSAAGYVTGYWGKWGYGGSKDQQQPVIENVQTLPTSHGYKHVLAELHHVRAHTFFQPTLWSAPAAPGSVGGLELIPNSLAHHKWQCHTQSELPLGSTSSAPDGRWTRLREIPDPQRHKGNDDYPSRPALQDHADYPKTAYCDDAYAFAALDFVRSQGQNYNKSGQPFFGLLAVQIPHAPFGEISTLPDWDKAYARDPHFESLADQTRQWAAMVTRIDAHFGNILAALDDPNNDGDRSDSIADNTLVVFQSDNGGPGGRNNVELDANGGLSGTKGRIQEGGIRVPLVMRWPAKVTARSKLKVGSNCDMVVDVTDLLPTFCEIAGAPVPLGIDGVSIAPTLAGVGLQRRREFIIHEAGNGQSIIRGNYKLIRAKRGPLQLFDLAEDRAEQQDIAAKHPELVTELATLLLGERVAEPKGFANTYHRWIGKDGSNTSDPGSWSDYKYSNAGIVYMEDDGAPRLSWIARIENSSDKSNVAQADRDLEVLGLEVRGNAAKNVQQSLVLRPRINLVGRNEIRLASHSTLTINGGSVSSLRWVDILAGAALNGNGSITGTVYNNGTVAVTGDDSPTLRVDGHYHQTADATLAVAVSGSRESFEVNGEAKLDGRLDIVIGEGFEPTRGESYSVLTAHQIAGKFANANDELVASDGTRFVINYSPSAVSLTAK